MKVGFWFFETFGNDNPNTIEVIPSASYIGLKDSDIAVRVPLCKIDKRYKKDILDAIAAAITGYCYAKKRFRSYGDEKEGYIITPEW